MEAPQKLMLMFASILFILKLTACSKMFVCYYTQTRYFQPSSVPARTCTHLIYAFGEIKYDGIQFGSSSDEAAAKTLIGLKRQNPKLKVLLSLQQGFPAVVRHMVTMEKFSLKAIAFLRKYGFDGVDFDWEYPSSANKVFYSRFLKIFRGNVVVESKLKRKPALLMSMALPNNVHVLNNGYDVISINKNVDFFTVMAYDFHVFNARRDNITGFNSPLYPVPGESKYFSASGLMEYCLTIGLKASKLLLGIPTYGRSYKLKDPNNHRLHSPAISRGDPGPYRHLHGIYTYSDTCAAIQTGASVVTDTKSHGKYLYKADVWVAYDDAITVGEKTRWAVNKNLAGVGIWAVELDDIAGVCTKTKLPLMNTIKNALNAKKTNNMYYH